MLFKTVSSLSHFEGCLRELFWCNTKQEIVFFSEHGKSWWSQNICLPRNTKTFTDKVRRIFCNLLGDIFLGQLKLQKVTKWGKKYILQHLRWHIFGPLVTGQWHRVRTDFENMIEVLSNWVSFVLRNSPWLLMKRNVMTPHNFALSTNRSKYIRFKNRNDGKQTPKKNWEKIWSKNINVGTNMQAKWKNIKQIRKKHLKNVKLYTVPKRNCRTI